MAQKINPISLRLEKTNRTIDSSWFNQCNYVNLFMKDLKIQWYINLIFKKIKFCSARYSIIHLPTKIKINIFFYNGNKNKKYICKIFYLNYPKKTKTIQKKFFNQAHIPFSIKQKQVSNYLIKSFNDKFSKQLILQTNLLETTDKKHVSSSQNALSIKNTSRNNENILFENYLKLLYFIKSYNQFYIRYFLIKYFSMKSAVHLNFKEKLQLLHEKKNLNSIEKALLITNELDNKCAKYSFHLFEKADFYKNISFKYILGFLFLQIYKNKKFLALKYFQTKINNYKKIFPLDKSFSPVALQRKKQNSNLILPLLCNAKEKFKKHKFKQNVYNANLEKKNDHNYINLNSIQNFVYFKHPLAVYVAKQRGAFPCEKPKIFFYTNFLRLKLNILDFLKKNTLNHTQLLKSPKKNNESNLNGLIKLTEISHKLEFSVKNIYGINSNNRINHNVFNKQNNKYYNLSLINAQCINDTYNHYCKLFQICKHYDNIYLSAHTNYKKNFFSLPVCQPIKDFKDWPFISQSKIGKQSNTVTSSVALQRKRQRQNNGLNSYVDLFQTDISTTLDKTMIPKKKKIILPSSPYKSHIETVLCNHFSCNINFQFFQTYNMFQNSFFLIDEVIYYIEKRVPFFKIKNYILKKLAEQKSNHIKGIRVMCSGRVGGKSKKAQRSKIQNFKYGETSLHVFSSKIDFKSKNAFTSFGTLGIKVWICYR